MAKVTNKELNECIAQAIAEVIKEEWADDVVNAAFNDKKARAAFEKDKKKEDELASSDNDKLEKDAAGDAAFADDDDDNDDSRLIPSELKNATYSKLKQIIAFSVPGTSMHRNATKELKIRNKILADKDSILSGEIIMPYGWEFDDDGYPIRTHTAINEDWEDDVVDAAMNDKVGQRAFFKKKINVKDADDEIISQAGKEEEADEEAEAAEEAKDAPENDDDDIDTSTTESVEEMGYEQLFDIFLDAFLNGKTKNALPRAARNEMMARNRVINDNTDIAPNNFLSKERRNDYLNLIKQYAKKYQSDVANKEIYPTYGFGVDENGYPCRTHLFRRPDVGGDRVDLANSNGTNFHWLKTKMSARGGKNPKYADDPEVGMQNADWV